MRSVILREISNTKEEEHTYYPKLMVKYSKNNIVHIK